MEFSVSHTTRAPRPEEQEGTDYYFIDHHSFEQMIEQEAFLEWARVHDNYYGTALAPIEEKLRSGVDIILDIDVQGADIVRQSSRMEYVDIFIAPPTTAELERRLRLRGTEDERSIATRLSNSVEEMQQSENYQYLIVNDRVEDAATMLSAIIYATRAEDRRGLNGIENPAWGE